MTSQLSIVYPKTVPPELGAVEEQIIAKATDDPHLFEVAGHAFMMPLGPGDIVRIDDDHNIVEVVHLQPQYIYHVDLHLPADFFAGPMPDDHPAKVTMERLFGEWQRDTWITVLTDFVCVVSSQSDRWIEDKVRRSKYVEAMTLTRTPETTSVPLEAKPVL